MQAKYWAPLALCALVSVTGCGGDDDDNGSGGSSGNGGSSGSGAQGGTAGDGGTAGVGGSGAAGGTAGVGGVGAAGGTAGVGGVGGAGGSGGEFACEAARDQMLSAQDKVSTGVVEVVSTDNGVSTVYIDATAGGSGQSSTNPAIYVNLAELTRADITDLASYTDPGWDIALKRYIIRVNGGDSGAGSARVAHLVSKAFDEVTAADAASATFRADDYLDSLCMPIEDPAGLPGDPSTAFTGWYSYGGTGAVSPNPITFLVYGSDGSSLYKLEIVDYFYTPVGGDRNSAQYLVRVAAL